MGNVSFLYEKKYGREKYFVSTIIIQLCNIPQNFNKFTHTQTQYLQTHSIIWIHTQMIFHAWDAWHYMKMDFFFYFFFGKHLQVTLFRYLLFEMSIKVNVNIEKDFYFYIKIYINGMICQSFCSEGLYTQSHTLHIYKFSDWILHQTIWWHFHIYARKWQINWLRIQKCQIDFWMLLQFCTIFFSVYAFCGFLIKNWVKSNFVCNQRDIWSKNKI